MLDPRTGRRGPSNPVRGMPAADGPISSRLEWHRDGVSTSESEHRRFRNPLSPTAPLPSAIPSGDFAPLGRVAALRGGRGAAGVPTQCRQLGRGLHGRGDPALSRVPRDSLPGTATARTGGTGTRSGPTRDAPDRWRRRLERAPSRRATVGRPGLAAPSPDRRFPLVVRRTVAAADLSRRGDERSPFQPFLDEIARYEEVHSDRVHVAIVACLMRRRCHVRSAATPLRADLFASSIATHHPDAVFHGELPSIPSQNS